MSAFYTVENAAKHYLDHLKTAAIELGKAEITIFMDGGRIPKTVSSFGELHDYIDANELCGFCDDTIHDAFVSLCGGRNADGDMPIAAVQFFNDVQDALGDWLRNGSV